MLRYLLLSLLPLCALGIPIDNGVEGDPEIECGPRGIAINVGTQNNFEGHVYVKNRFNEPDCRNDEANPKGIFVSTTVVISFHPRFLTKVDRAYTIQCFYMEADKTVSTEIEVSMITTGFETQFVPMPVCRYEILEGGPSGPVIKFAIIGQQVYHKWTCDSETTDTFCMVVHTCYVDDGAGDRMDLIDTDGCSLDRNLVDNLDYPTDLMAGKEAHVFKYADRPALFFTCQITITVKEPNQDCERPQCSQAPATQGRKRRSTNDMVDIDVAAPQLEVFDITDKRPQLPKTFDSRAGPATIQFVNSDPSDDNVSDVCFSPLAFGAILLVMLAGMVLTLVVVFTVFSRRELQAKAH